jgi:hypothetical protein
MVRPRRPRVFASMALLLVKVPGDKRGKSAPLGGSDRQCRQLRVKMDGSMPKVAGPSHSFTKLTFSAARRFVYCLSKRTLSSDCVPVLVSTTL